MGADRRKLNAEIEKVFRKVEEGVEEFESIMTKMQEANSENQREKFQDDLKKEIKKLQRQRDQIKGWQNSNDVKDKDRLGGYRKTIEQRMEQFKEIERENKTKSYSKQGLQSMDKRDPREQQRQETIDWLQGCIEKLSTQCDFLECNVESLTGSSGKKKKQQQNNDKEVDEYRSKLDRHKYHIRQLEVIMRLVNNDGLQCSDVTDLKEDLEDYISRNQEPDFIENEFIYEDLNLGDLTELTQQLGNVTNIGTLEEAENASEENTTASGSPSPSPGPTLHNHTSVDFPSDPDSPKQRHVSGSEGGTTTGLKILVPPARSTPVTPLKLTSQMSIDSALSSPPPAATPPPPPGIPYNSIAARGSSIVKQIPNTSSSSSNSAVAKPLFDSSPQSFGDSMDGLNQGTLAGGHKASASPLPLSAGVSATTGFFPPSSTGPIGSVGSRQGPGAISTTTTQPPPPSSLFPSSLGDRPAADLIQAALAARQTSPTKNVSSPIMNGPGSVEEINSVLPLKSLAENAQQQLMLHNSGSIPDQLLRPDGIMNSGIHAGVYDYLRPAQPSGTPQEAKIPPILGASPLGKVVMLPEHQSQLHLLEAAINQRMPLPMDSERLRVYVVRNPCPAPGYYPQTPPLLSETLEYFNRLQPETLFFIFYYMEGTKAQYLAAKALKKQSWRFHKKYLMWFQRHEEPVCITDDYEQGTYVYFDFEKWSQRKKENFTFEYQFLEDRDLS